MSVGIGAAIAIGGLASAGAGVTSAVIGSKAAKGAAQTQAAAADQIRQQAIDAGKTASETMTKAGDDANTTLTDAEKIRLEKLKPYLDAGTTSLGDLQTLLGTNGPLGQGGNFSYTAKDWQNDPAYAYLKDQAIRATENSAAARGSLLTGGFAKGLQKNVMGLANTYMDAGFNRALQTYQTNRENALLRIQGLQGLTGLGYNATQLQDNVIGGTEGQVAQNKLNVGEYVANTGVNAANTAAAALGQKADAIAAGKVGSANAITNGITTATNGLMNGALLYSMAPLTLPTKYQAPAGTTGPLNPTPAMPPMSSTTPNLRNTRPDWVN